MSDMEKKQEVVEITNTEAQPKEGAGRVVKTLLCCIGRKENQYIREFVEYNKMAGFTNICLFDNNYD